MDLKLDPLTGDLDLSGNEIKLNSSNVESVEQHWRIRMQAVRGDWFLDLRVGIPYYEEVLVKNPNTAALRSIFHEASLQTPGIREITAFSLDLSADRVLSVAIEGQTEELEDFSFEYEEMILSQQGAAV